MPLGRPSRLWCKAIRETLIGQRGLMKVNHMWLPAGTVLVLSGQAWGEGVAVRSLLLFAVLACWSQAGIQVNDLADRTQDACAGKSRWVWQLPGRSGYALVLVLAAAGLLLTVLVTRSAAAAVVYAAGAAMTTLYSQPPARFKERQLVGFVNYSVSSSLNFALLPWLWFHSDWLTLSVLFPAVVLDKWVNLLFHQMVDWRADRAGGARTWVVAVGPQAARRALKWTSYLAAAWLALTEGYVAVRMPAGGALVAAVAGLIGVAAGVHVAATRNSPRRSPLVTELPWTYLGLTLALFRAVPFVLFLALAATRPAMVPVFVICALLLTVEALHSLDYRCE